MIKDSITFAARLFARLLTLVALCSCLFVSRLGYSRNTGHSAKELIFKMIKSIDRVERFKYSLKITGRGKKGYSYDESWEDRRVYQRIQHRLQEYKF